MKTLSATLKELWRLGLPRRRETVEAQDVLSGNPFAYGTPEDTVRLMITCLPPAWGLERKTPIPPSIEPDKND
ncbi:hypothetical protein IFT48_05035 [Pseudomonas fluorescens]|uniref:hypothetical protein n=1 Tax=Pseudomonas TaxID=286 RepID=UPI0013CEAC7C|nr:MULTISPECIES: hypothetical protein [Pseudomonas]MBD8089340.1 hypothetical protein [Pseudomonas fluorescens]MBD8615233.1 hypothetical protein [Pseudomonas putida]MBD8682113.1 hypothetical protein [Pseudomonas sp. CFBP 13719]